MAIATVSADSAARPAARLAARPFTADEDASIVTLLAAGTGWTTIADVLGRTPGTVYCRAVRRGMHTPVPRPRSARRRMPLPGERRRALPGQVPRR